MFLRANDLKQLKVAKVDQSLEKASDVILWGM